MDIEPMAFAVEITLRGVDLRLQVRIPVEAQTALLGSEGPRLTLPSTSAYTEGFGLKAVLEKSHEGLHQLAEELLLVLCDESNRILREAAEHLLVGAPRRV